MEELYPLEASWIVALVAGTLALILLLQLARSLPGQNVLLIVLVLLACEALLEFFMARLGRTKVAGPMWCYLAGGALLWMALILSARRLGQFILRPWRRKNLYGIWLLAICAVLTGTFQFLWPRVNNPDEVVLQKAVLTPPAATEQEGEPGIAAPRAPGAALETQEEQEMEKMVVRPTRAALMSGIRAFSTVVLLVCLSPWFIRKRPIPRAGGSEELAQQPENQTQQGAGEKTGG